MRRNDQKQRKDSVRTETDKEHLTAAQCKKLIEQLVNPDGPPFEGLTARELPKQVDQRRLNEWQQKVGAAYRRTE